MSTTLHTTLLRAHGFKVTPGRLAILQALSLQHMPMNAEEIQDKAKKAKLDLVTIYRTLSSFEKAGIVRRVDLRQSSASYELVADHHHHIVCTECGVVEDFELCDMEKTVKKIAAQSVRFKTVREHTLELFGICTTCTK